MRTDIIDYLSSKIYALSISDNNHFGIGCYYHILAVVRNVSLLYNKYNADQEIVIIAAWLHDIASITSYDMYSNHHIYGAEIAKEILLSYNYNPDKLECVINCIKNHRGSISSNKTSPEELCVADADAMSHFDNIPSLLYLAYVHKSLSIEDGCQFVKNKLNRSFDKLSPLGKNLYSDKYSQAMNLLN